LMTRSISSSASAEPLADDEIERVIKVLHTTMAVGV